VRGRDAGGGGGGEGGGGGGGGWKMVRQCVESKNITSSEISRLRSLVLMTKVA